MDKLVEIMKEHAGVNIPRNSWKKVENGLYVPRSTWTSPNEDWTPNLRFGGGNYVSITGRIIPLREQSISLEGRALQDGYLLLQGLHRVQMDDHDDKEPMRIYRCLGDSEVEFMKLSDDGTAMFVDEHGEYNPLSTVHPSSPWSGVIKTSHGLHPTDGTALLYVIETRKR